LKHFWKQHGLWVLFAAAVVAVGLALISYFSNTSSPLANVAGVVSSPFRTAYTSVAGWFNDKQDYYRDTRALEAENKDLKSRIAKMEEEVRQAQSDSDENKRLRKLLNLREKQRDFSLEPAAVIAHSDSNWTSSLTLNCGTNRGIAVNDCVVTEDQYLVGVVSEAGVNWCTVLTVLDTDTSLGAKVFRTDDIGVAEGDFDLMDQGKLKLSYLPADCSLLNGDLIVTSGLGGYYPSGLVIGSVDEVKLDDSGTTQYAVLSPSADISNLTEVFVIKSFDIVD
jgi:rod shape-determining protein MreC